MPPAPGKRKRAAPVPVAVQLPITLGQFLKVASLVSSGGEAKMLVAEGSVRVNGETEQRRGRKLVPGDVVQTHSAAARVEAAGAVSSGDPSPNQPS
jgi:ribosome-associated protein